MRYTAPMRRQITHRQLRSEGGRIMRKVDEGKSFIVTRNGVPVAELSPLRQRLFVCSDAVLGAFAGSPRIRRARFRKEVDAAIDQYAARRR